MRIAIVHYWLVGMRGGEKVLEALCDLYPTADIYTHVFVPDALSKAITSHNVFTSFIARLPRAAVWYKIYLPLMPLALEQLDLRKYDLIISSESGPAKGIIPAPHAVHVCYCHSPMRYIWNMYLDYRSQAGSLTRPALAVLAHYLRQWDFSSAARVDLFVANSHNVAARIQKYFRRDAEVIYPPVDVENFKREKHLGAADYYLMVGELTAYKRPDLAIDAFNASGRKLVVIGGGEMLREIKRKAGPNITVLGPQPFESLRSHYSRCRALIFPGEEDFGIVPVEAMASGCPVIAFGRGGALETVVDGMTGVFFETQTSDSIESAIRRADGVKFNSEVIARHAAKFNRARFVRQMKGTIDRALRTNIPPSSYLQTATDALSSAHASNG